MTICSGFPRGDPYGLLAQTNIFYRLFAMRGNDHMLGLPTRKSLWGCSRKQIFFIACLQYVGATAWGARYALRVPRNDIVNLSLKARSAI